MVNGTLEVLLVGAKGLENTDYLCNMDPYAVLKCRSQEQRSSIASGKGSNPEWNESFVFTVSDHATELVIKLMDSDSGTADDFVGEATIPLEAVYTGGSIPPTVYNVVKGEHYCGEIKVGLTFTPEPQTTKVPSISDGKSAGGTTHCLLGYQDWMFASAVSPRTSVDGNNHIDQIWKNKDARDALRP